MAIPDAHRTNFQTLLKAAENNDLAVLECRELDGKTPVYVIVAVHQDDEGLFNMVPFARLFDGNPYEELLPPGEGSGFETSPAVGP